MLACRAVLFELTIACETRILLLELSYWRELLEAASDLEIVPALVVPQLYNGMRKPSPWLCPLRQFPGTSDTGWKA